ncbi:MAG: hypothetical protein C0501_29890 [Isosphaera sp.]|nr:hypothetical protein [Isosphaera sp.]
MIRSLLFGTAAAAAVGCSGNTAPTGGGPDGKTPQGGTPSAARPVELTLTAEELGKAYESDPAGFKAKYGGKWVELTGEVELPRVVATGPTDVLLRGYLKPKGIVPGFVSILPRKEEQGKFEGMKALAKGQSVTVRGEVATFAPALDKCEFVKVGPSAAVPFTPSGLLAALKAPDGEKKYDGKDVVMRAEVRKAEWNGTVATLTVWDPGVKDGPGLEASLNPQEKKVGEELAKIKPGTVVVLLGETQTLNDGRLWNVRVLKEPPEGVTLPGDKK